MPFGVNFAAQAANYLRQSAISHDDSAVMHSMMKAAAAVSSFFGERTSMNLSVSRTPSLNDTGGRESSGATLLYNGGHARCLAILSRWSVWCQCLREVRGGAR